VSEYGRDELRKVVGDHHFLEQPRGEDRKSSRREHRRTPGTTAFELRDHLGVMHQRSCDQVREERHEKRIADDVAFDFRAAHHVDEIGDLLEREEGYAERKHDVDERKRRARQHVDAFDDEICVFEIAEQRQVERNPDNADSATATRILHRQAERKIRRDRGDQQHQIDRPPGAIEEQRRTDQHQDAGARGMTPCGREGQHDGGEKLQQESVGGEQHRFRA